MAVITAHLNARSSSHSGGDSVAIGIIVSLSLSPTSVTPPPPFSPSLISRTVSVDVKHHVYLFTFLLLFFLLLLLLLKCNSRPVFVLLCHDQTFCKPNSNGHARAGKINLAYWCLYTDAGRIALHWTWGDKCDWNPRKPRKHRSGQFRRNNLILHK